MNKKEFVKAVAAESGLTGVDAAKAVDAMQRVVSVSMQRGESIIIPGFGSFSLKECKARMGRNPRTGEPLKIPAKQEPDAAIPHHYQGWCQEKESNRQVVNSEVSIVPLTGISCYKGDFGLFRVVTRGGQ